MSQHYLYELVIKTLVHHNLFYMLHQFLQYHVLSDSKPLVSSQVRDEKGNTVQLLHILIQQINAVVSFSSGVFTSVSGEHVSSFSPAVTGHVEAFVHCQ